MARSTLRSCEENDIGYKFTLLCQSIEYAVALTFGQFHHEPKPADFHLWETLAAQVRDRHVLSARISRRGVQWVGN